MSVEGKSALSLTGWVRDEGENVLSLTGWVRDGEECRIIFLGSGIDLSDSTVREIILAYRAVRHDVHSHVRRTVTCPQTEMAVLLKWGNPLLFIVPGQ